MKFTASPVEISTSISFLTGRLTLRAALENDFEFCFTRGAFHFHGGRHEQ
jgi:hypothetical protein